MAYNNFSVACHRHKCRVDILRGYEQYAIRGFYEDHLDCYKLNPHNLEVAINNNKSEPRWLQDGFYDSEVFPPDSMNVNLIIWKSRLKHSYVDRSMIKAINSI